MIFLHPHPFSSITILFNQNVWLYYRTAVFCCLTRTYCTRISTSLFTYWFEGICVSFERWIYIDACWYRCLSLLYSSNVFALFVSALIIRYIYMFLIASFEVHDSVCLFPDYLTYIYICVYISSDILHLFMVHDTSFCLYYTGAGCKNSLCYNSIECLR